MRARIVLVGLMGLMLVAMSSTLPADAAPAVNVRVVSTAGSDGGPVETSVACISAGNCVIAGYRSGDHVFVRAERSGHWGRSINPIENLGKYSGSSINTLSCFRGGCLLFGTLTPYTISHSTSYFTVLYSGKTWQRAKPALLSLGAAKGFDIAALSCTDSRDCVAVGRVPFSGNTVNYSKFVSAPAVLTLSNGQWRSPTLIGPKSIGFPAEFADVSCPTWGNCVAVGIGNLDGHFTSIETTESRGTWSPVTAPFSQELEVLSISCPTMRDCTAGGRDDSPSDGGAFVDSEQSGQWLHAIPLGRQWTVKDGYSQSSVDFLSCFNAVTCVVAGRLDGPRPTLSRKVSVSSVAWVANEIGGKWNAGTTIGYRPGKINQGQVAGLSCPSATTCVVVGQSGIESTKLDQIGRAKNFLATVIP